MALRGRLATNIRPAANHSADYHATLICRRQKDLGAHNVLCSGDIECVACVCTRRTRAAPLLAEQQRRLDLVLYNGVLLYIQPQ